jgi:hypothetical protein
VEIARKRDTGRRLAELENSKCPDSTQRVYGREAAGKPLQRKREKGYWKETCGTGIGGTNEHSILSCENFDYGRGQAYI